LSPPTITNTKASHKTQNIKTPSPEYLLWPTTQSSNTITNAPHH
jgi:hypothetical protein